MRKLNKKLLGLVVCFCVIICSGCDGNPNTTTWPLLQPENSYEVDAWGTNPDLLEFTPKHNPNYFCVLAISGVDELKTMFCMPKAK